MDAPLNQVFYPASFSDLFAAWDRFPEAKVYAGGTELIRRQGDSILVLPPIIICLDKLKELSRIARTERYLEIGAMAKLNQILWLGKAVPAALCLCLENIGGIQLRNLATIGGSVCCPSRLMDTSAPLAALDAQYELRSAQTSRWISASRFYSGRERIMLAPQELLTRIRLPLDPWDYSAFTKFPSGSIEDTEVMVFLAKTRKDILTDIKAVFKGTSLLRSKASEDILIGKRLPLSRREAGIFAKSWEDFLCDKHDIKEITKNQIANCIEINVNNLAE